MQRMFAILLLSFSLLGCSDRQGNLEAREAYWQSLVSTELRPGTPLPKVEAFFKRYRLEHGYNEPLHSIHAIERNVAGNSIVSFSIIFSCQFSSANTLIGCTVFHIGEGP